MTILDTLPHKVEIQERIKTQDRLKGNNYGHRAKKGKASVEAFVQPASASEIERFSRKDTIVTHAVYFSEDPGFNKTGDRLIFEGKILDIRAHFDGTLELDFAFVAFCEEFGTQDS